MPLPKTTPAQDETIRHFLQEAWKKAAGFYLDYEADYEYKNFEVTEISHKTIAVIVEIGLIGDEGTFASIFGRTRAQVFVGRNGGVSWYGGKKHTRREGRRNLWRAFYDQSR